MKINLYYEFPNSSALTNGSIYVSWPILFSKLSDILIEKHPEINFEKKFRWSGDMSSKNPWSTELSVPFDKNTHSSISDTIFIIENEENKKYFVISLWDKGYYEISVWSDLEEKCVEIFSHAGMHISDYSYELSPLKYTPLNMPVILNGEEEIINELYHQNLKNDTRIIPDKLFFQSSRPYLFREYIHYNDNRFNSVIGYDRNMRDWLMKLSQYKINMDINCVAEPSGRISQILGLGMVLVRPNLRHQFQNPLIPDYHYVEVKHDFYDPTKYETINSFYKSLSDAYIDTFERVKNDEEFLRYVSKNGREYWENYCVSSNWLKTTVSLINLDKLM
jgi:hypothetical protein